MHRRLKISAFLAVTALWLGLAWTASAQDPEPAADKPKDEPKSQKAAADEAAEETPAEETAAAQSEQEAEAEEDDDEEEYDEEEYDEEYYDEDYDLDEDQVGAEAAQEEQEARPDGALGLDLGLYYRSDGAGSTLELAPLLSGWYAVMDDLDVTLDWGFAFRNFSPEQGDSSGSFVIGNPFLAVRRVLQEGRTQIFFGLGVSAPLSSVPERPDAATASAEEVRDYDNAVAAYLTASAMRGTWNHYLWMPEHLGIVLPLGASMVTEGHLLVGGETAFYVLIPVSDYNEHRSDFYIQLAGDIGFGWDTVATGVRLQGMVNTTADGDRMQSAFGPFVRLQMQRAYLTARFLFNLDQPYGIFNGADVWGLHLGGGAFF